MEIMDTDGGANEQSPLMNYSEDRTDNWRMMMPPRNYNAATQSQRLWQLRKEASVKGKPRQRRSLLQQARCQSSAGIFHQVFDVAALPPVEDDHFGVRKTTAAAPTSVSASTIKRRHSWLYSMLSPHSHQPQAEIFKLFIATVIISDMILFIISTDPRYKSNLFHTAEGIVSGIFLVEYVARLYVITEQKRYSHHPLWGRLRYACTTFAGWIDFLATAPYFIETITGWDMPRVTILRVFRLFRILRTQSYMRALDAVYRVVYYNSQILQVSALLCLFLMLTTAVLLYYFRPPDDENFNSMTSTLYMSTLILTGQGGPDGPLPIQTKIVVLITSIVSVAFYSVPASMLVWGFEAEAERMAKRARRRQKKMVDDDNDDEYWSSSYSSSSSGSTTDEEYFRMIAGEESESETEQDTPKMKQIREAFQKADLNMDGTLSIREATELLTNYSVNNIDFIDKTVALADRIDALENKMNAQNEKLEQVIALLQSK